MHTCAVARSAAKTPPFPDARSADVRFLIASACIFHDTTRRRAPPIVGSLVLLQRSRAHSDRHLRGVPVPCARTAARWFAGSRDIGIHEGGSRHLNHDPASSGADVDFERPSGGGGGSQPEPAPGSCVWSGGGVSLTPPAWVVARSLFPPFRALQTAL